MKADKARKIIIPFLIVIIIVESFIIIYPKMKSNNTYKFSYTLNKTEFTTGEILKVKANCQFVSGVPFVYKGETGFSPNMQLIGKKGNVYTIGIYVPDSEDNELYFAAPGKTSLDTVGQFCFNFDMPEGYYSLLLCYGTYTEEISDVIYYKK